VLLNGTLSVDLCSGDTLFDTMLFVGDGCPANATTFRCRGASDDACSQQSRVAIEGVASPRMYVIVGGYEGAFGPYKLQWSYEPSTPSSTPSPSATRSSTATGTRSSTRGASPLNRDEMSVDVRASSSSAATPAESGAAT
jgi:hypothetical protein